jgi:hypothetical protein
MPSLLNIPPLPIYYYYYYYYYYVLLVISLCSLLFSSNGLLGEYKPQLVIPILERIIIHSYERVIVQVHFFCRLIWSFFFNSASLHIFSINFQKGTQIVFKRSFFKNCRKIIFLTSFCTCFKNSYHAYIRCWASLSLSLQFFIHPIIPSFHIVLDIFFSTLHNWLGLPIQQLVIWLVTSIVNL